MVVVSDDWVRNVTNYQQQQNNNNGVDEMVISTATAMDVCAKAVLICRPNSHPFQERTLCLEQPIKVGRSVARARAAQNNAIFDCKVLSRHHALLWYDNGKFYLQDTKSSNGTFVNNTRLSSNESEPHELSSGDIVQFGVDVMENNRKVTHGCIIATLKLYLPDGKEAKASPSITEANRQGLVPMDELYKLNQIIQEATRREQCLETKLAALKHFTEEAKKSADFTWQVRVDEERLLSRVAALENQLLQAGKNWTNERLREEYTKLEEDKLSYQVAAKEALQKLHSEKLEAIAQAAEQERARATAEQEAQLARDLLTETQMEITVLAQKLVEEQKRADEEKARLEEQEKELQARLESESQTAIELQAKLDQLNTSLHIHNSCPAIFREILPLEELEKSSLIYDEENLKSKEDLLEENENENENENDDCETRNEPEQNHINLKVALVAQETSQLTDSESLVAESDNESGKESSVREVRVTFKLPESTKDDELSSEATEEPSNSDETEKTDTTDEKPFDHDHIDSKTLKYQYQSAQNELKRQIEHLETTTTLNQQKITDLQKELTEHKQIIAEKTKLCEMLKQELQSLQEKLRGSCSECERLQGEVEGLNEVVEGLKSSGGEKISESLLSVEEISALEEELVLLKEKYVEITQEKTDLKKQLTCLQTQYNVVCNKSHNTMFFYVAPLVLLLLYLLVSSMAS